MRYVDPVWTINDLLRLIPQSAATLSRLGIDTCCGGSLLVRDAAASAGTTVAEIMADLVRSKVAATNTERRAGRPEPTAG